MLLQLALLALLVFAALAYALPQARREVWGGFRTMAEDSGALFYGAVLALGVLTVAAVVDDSGPLASICLLVAIALVVQARSMGAEDIGVEERTELDADYDALKREGYDGFAQQKATGDLYAFQRQQNRIGFGHGTYTPHSEL